ncbi:metallophosphoesterase [Flavitalea antarctica]
MARTIAIGDIHGALQALHQLLTIIRPARDDRFIFLGDYVDGWPESAQVITFLINFSKDHHCTFIKGNHDVWCQLWLEGNKPDSIWLRHGGYATIDSYKEIVDKDRHDHIEFFAKLENYLVHDSNRLFIHAGYSTLEGPDFEFRDGKYNWDRSLWQKALRLHDKVGSKAEDYPPVFRLFEEIYIGHTPTIFYDVSVPIRALNIVNVDTGAGFDGKLSALEVTTGELWQSDTIPGYYPGSEGRSR